VTAYNRCALCFTSCSNASWQSLPAHNRPPWILRPQHQNVRCTWDGRALRLGADNDYDDNGLALRDEFSDAISACVKGPGDGDLRVISVTTFRVLTSIAPASFDLLIGVPGLIGDTVKCLRSRRVDGFRIFRHVSSSHLCHSNSCFSTSCGPAAVFDGRRLKSPDHS